METEVPGKKIRKVSTKKLMPITVIADKNYDVPVDYKEISYRVWKLDSDNQRIVELDPLSHHEINR
jgi:hypothetical protein